jgi:hypothetical protein
MSGNPSRGAWIWVTVVAISLASLARAQSGMGHARAYADPVIKFLTANDLPDSSVSVTAARAGTHSQANASALVLGLLPVFFVGLVAPLNLLSARWVLCLGLALFAPDRPELFQRPPPALLA